MNENSKWICNSAEKVFFFLILLNRFYELKSFFLKTQIKWDIKNKNYRVIAIFPQTWDISENCSKTISSPINLLTTSLLQPRSFKWWILLAIVVSTLAVTKAISCYYSFCSTTWSILITVNRNVMLGVITL